MVSREDVMAAYRLILGRPAESDEAIAYHMTHPDLPTLRRAMLGSDEFVGFFKALTTTLDYVPVEEILTPAQAIDLATTEDERRAMWAQTSANWRALGEEQPHYSVVSLEQFRPDRIGETLDEFMASGAEDARLVDRALERLPEAAAIRAGLCLEIGCGVARVTRTLATRFARVLGVDISEPHLALARAALAEAGVANAEVRRMTSIEDYAALPEPSFVFSRFVLHHNPPPVQAAILGAVLDRLARPGAALFQAVAYMDGYRFRAADYLATPKTGLEMHVLPQPEVHRLIREHGCELLEVQRDDTAVQDAHLRSFFYLVRKA